MLLTVELEMRIEAENEILASDIASRHELRILSRLWEAEGAEERITALKETAYISNIWTAPVGSGVKLG